MTDDKQEMYISIIRHGLVVYTNVSNILIGRFKCMVSDKCVAEPVVNVVNDEPHAKRRQQQCSLVQNLGVLHIACMSIEGLDNKNQQ